MNLNIEMNHEVQVEIDSNGGVGTPTYVDMKNAFDNIGVAINENVLVTSYLADEGFSSSEVVGFAPTVSLSGHFKPDDPACKYLASIEFQLGAGRKSSIRLQRVGTVITCPVTLTAISISGGQAQAPNAISVTIAFNGKPTMVPAPSG
jgi:hypothetical protein